MFIQNYFNLLASNPITTIVTSALILLFIISACLSLYFYILQILVSYWSQGEVERQNNFHLWLFKVTGGGEIKIGMPCKRSPSYKLTEHKSGGFGFKDSCGDYLTRTSSTCFCADAIVVARCLFVTKEQAAMALGETNGINSLELYLSFLCAFLLIPTVSLFLDWTFSNYPSILFSCITLCTVIYAVLTGGRKLYSFNKKLSKLSEKED